jgi:uncharacterized protein YfiM (DUF2279 family)
MARLEVENFAESAMICAAGTEYTAAFERADENKFVRLRNVEVFDITLFNFDYDRI